MPLTPTQLSLRDLRAEWPLVEVVERWNSHARIRQDLFDLIDVLAVGPKGTMAVQTTTFGNFNARVAKIQAHPATPEIQAAGWVLAVHGWKKDNGRWMLARFRAMTNGDKMSDPIKFCVQCGRSKFYSRGLSVADRLDWEANEKSLCPKCIKGYHQVRPAPTGKPSCAGCGAKGRKLLEGVCGKCQGKGISAPTLFEGLGT